MNKLKQLENEFRSGRLKKEDYIRKMHDVHMVLWAYLDFIRNKNIDSIEISREQIILRTKDGIKMVCDPEDERIVPMEILNFGDYETTEIQMIRKLLNKNSIILDIGANIGWYCLSLSKDVPEGCIIAFEPISKTFEYLKQNVALNDIKNVRLYNFGLLDKEGFSEFYYDPKLSGATSLRKLHENRKKQKIRCKVRRLDDFISEITSRIDFIKCDVEGAEIFVIKGALETLKRMRPVLFLEMLRKWSAKFGYHPNEIINLLSSTGYKCYYVENEKFVRIKEINEETVATNFFFLDAERHTKFLRSF